MNSAGATPALKNSELFSTIHQEHYDTSEAGASEILLGADPKEIWSIPATKTRIGEMNINVRCLRFGVRGWVFSSWRSQVSSFIFLKAFRLASLVSPRGTVETEGQFDSNPAHDCSVWVLKRPGKMLP